MFFKSWDHRNYKYKLVANLFATKFVVSFGRVLHKILWVSQLMHIKNCQPKVISIGAIGFLPKGLVGSQLSHKEMQRWYERVIISCYAYYTLVLMCANASAIASQKLVQVLPYPVLSWSVPLCSVLFRSVLFGSIRFCLILFCPVLTWSFLFYPALVRFVPSHFIPSRSDQFPFVPSRTVLLLSL